MKSDPNAPCTSGQLINTCKSFGRGRAGAGRGARDRDLCRAQERESTSTIAEARGRRKATAILPRRESRTNRWLIHGRNRLVELREHETRCDELLFRLLHG